MRSDSGAALVEFALVLPVLILMLFGMLEFGKVFNYWIDQTHLANEGARWAVVNNGNPGSCPDGSTPASLQAYIKCQADTKELRDNVQVRVLTTGAVGSPVTVCVRYQTPVPIVHTISNAFFGGGIASTVPVTGSSTMRLEAATTNFTPDGTGTSC
jgi:TadE-like protein